MTGARTSGGTCGSIRRNAKNLTWARSVGDHPEKSGLLARDTDRGAAWLSSARAVRCWVKSRNERNPCTQLLLAREDSVWTAPDNGEEGGDDVKSGWPLRPGLHTYYNARHKGKQNRQVEPIPKNRAQFRLKSATRLHEAGIASNGVSATTP